MQSLIKFRLLANKLNKSEIQSLVFNLLEQYGTDFILETIFNHFIKSIQISSTEHINKVQHFCICGKPLSSKRGVIDCNECHKTSNSRKLYWFCNEKKKDHHPIHDTQGYNICNVCIHKYSKQSFQLNQIQCINQMISDIIHSRKKQEKSQQFQTENDVHIRLEIKLDELPPPLISKTASFLPMRSYIALQRSNRKLYIGCNTPFSLQVVNTINCRTKHVINWNKLLSIKSLHLNLWYIDKLMPHNIVFNNITQLTLHNNDDDSIDDFELFKERNYINFDQIQTLALHNFGSNGYDLEPNKFLKVLSMFPNVQCLDLKCIFLFNYNYSDDDISALFPKLKHIKCSDMNRALWERFLKVYGDKIVSLDCYDDCMYGTLSNVETLRIRTPQHNTLMNLMNKHKLCALKDICIDNLKIKNANMNETKNGIVNLMNINTLERIELRQNYKVFKTSLFDDVENGLFKAPNLRKNRFEVIFRFRTKTRNEIETEELLKSIRRLILQIDSCCITHWIIYCELKMDFGDERTVFCDQCSINKLKEKYLVNHFKTNISEILTVSNKNQKYY